MIKLHGRDIGTKDDFLNLYCESGISMHDLIIEAYKEMYKNTKCEDCIYLKKRYNGIYPCSGCTHCDVKLHKEFCIRNRYEEV